MTVTEGAGRHSYRTGLADLGLDRLRPVDLQTVLAAAELQTRVDRKYLVPATTLRDVLADLTDTHHVLQIAGRRGTTYSSHYFDSPDRTAFRAHVQGRRRRWKVRSRLYREDLLCRMEVKADMAGTTVKHAVDLPSQAHGQLTEEAVEFLTDRFHTLGLDGDVEELTTSAHVEYVRATVCDLTAGTRLTIDSRLVATLDDRAVAMRDDILLVETKGTGRASLADRALMANGVRPASVSKYGVTLSVLEPWLPGNRWRRVARGYFAQC